MASILFLASWAVMMGPIVYRKHPHGPNLSDCLGCVLCLKSWLADPGGRQPVLATPNQMYRADHSQSVRHLISQDRLPFTATYFGSVALTLYFAVGVSSPQSLPRCPTAPLCYACYSHSTSLRPCSTDSCHIDAASKWLPDRDILGCAASSTFLVLDQLFPHGIAGSSLCCQFRHQPSRCLDEWMIDHGSYKHVPTFTYLQVWRKFGTLSEQGSFL
nr:hypothetical protein CFP56_00778 [Quercus suber]